MTPHDKNLLTLLDYTPETVHGILSLAAQLKKNRLSADPGSFNGKTGVLIFEKPSLRTRLTFEIAINELGGTAINLSADMVRMGKRESVADVARNLERWVHLIIARTFEHQTVVELARHSRIPVINALTDRSHPCQALAFGLTVQERLAGKKGLKVVWVGDGNNVCTSIMELCALLGYHYSVVCPPGYEPPAAIVGQCREMAHRLGARIEVIHDIASGVRDASVIYTDVWTSMGQEQETQKRRTAFAAYQVNAAVVAAAPADVLVSHCLPAHRGEEITSDVLDSQRSIAFDEAENRLHVQKAVIHHLFS